MSLIMLACTVLVIIAFWKIFEKMGEPGWKSIIPFYNTWVLFEHTVNNNELWFILSFVPGVNAAALIISYVALCKTFEKDTGFTILTCFFPVVTLPILGFGDAVYRSEYKF